MIEHKRKRCDQEEVDDLEYDLQNKRQRLQKNTMQIQQRKKKTQYHFFRNWRNGLRRQIGKGQNRTRINRTAETAVYNVLYEQLEAHERRWGDEGTGYFEGKRIQSKELRRIANQHLKSKGLPLIKSKETVRSWGKPRNKRSRQAKQHRGKGLWKRKRAEKKRSDIHINSHYNRAHVKNYTRLIFQNGSPYKEFSVRRAIDDKAYLRCGTSEGFSRPIHTPVQLSAENLQFRLPSSDYPQECGYVSPGVILLVNDMNEVEYKNTDRYVKEDVTVTVTCKPKLVYPNSATNWFNDLYRVRYLFAEEHQVAKTDLCDSQQSCDAVQENQDHAFDQTDSETKDSQVLGKQCQTYLSVIRDSLFQFEMMNITDDFIRCIERGDHQKRELLRIHVLSERLIKLMPTVAEVEDLRPQLQKILESLNKLKGENFCYP